MLTKIEHLELQYTYDEITYIKDFYSWNKLKLYLDKLKLYATTEEELQYRIKKLNIK